MANKTSKPQHLLQRDRRTQESQRLPQSTHPAAMHRYLTVPRRSGSYLLLCR